MRFLFTTEFTISPFSLILFSFPVKATDETGLHFAF